MEAIRTGSYAVHFEKEAVRALGQHLDEVPYSRVFLLTDENTARDCMPLALQMFTGVREWHHISMPAGEENKTLETCLKIWHELSREGADRQSLLINLGGGVVTDLGGFVAATYQRGIRFINIPTTLLSMVDASIGGKTGVDLGSLKNQIGVIEQPELVLVCPEFLGTLPDRELRSGFAEMLKHGLIADAAYWEALTQLESPGESLPFIHQSVVIKNEVVIADPTEKNLRKILNFGHTLGHAIESYFLGQGSGKSLLHGEAIAIGMVLESYLSVRLCNLDPADCDRIKAEFLRLFPKVRIDPGQVDTIASLLVHDKKNTHGRVLYTLLNRIGEATYNCEVPTEMLQEAFAYYRD